MSSKWHQGSARCGGHLAHGETQEGIQKPQQGRNLQVPAEEGCTQLTWLVYALVEATPISAPALMCTPQSVSRAMVLPTVLVMPTHSAPRALMYSSAFTPTNWSHC